MRLDHLLSKEDMSRLKMAQTFGILFNFEGIGFPEFGGLAQLGEHLLCKQGVKSSILLISTKYEYLSG